MKITAVPRGGNPQATATPNSGPSASADRLARATAIAAGQDPVNAVVPQQEQTVSQKLKTIRMKTNATPAGRDWTPPVQETAPQNVVNPDEGEPTTEANEDIKPLSPQFAALAKQKRALQLKEREIQAREEALKTTSHSSTDAKTMIERMKADPLGLLLENGVTYDQLTNAVLRDMEGGGPALTKVENDLRKEIKDLKEALDNQTKTQTDAQTATEQRVYSQLQKQADKLIAADDTYQMIRETGSNKDVTALIKSIRDDEGEEISVVEALDIIENDLLEESLKIARINKVQKKLQPEPVSQQRQYDQPQDGVRRQTMRTLTSRDSVQPIPSRRERAMAAALGKKLA